MSKILLRANSGGSVSLQGEDSAVDTVVTVPSGDVTMATTDEINNGIGVNQTWQDVVGSRTSGVEYTNTTGKPIMVAIVGTTTTTSNSRVDSYLGAIRVGRIQGTNGEVTIGDSSFIVPNDASYTVTSVQGATIDVWSELRGA